MSHDVNAARAQLLDDFNKVVGDTESLLKAMASVPGEKAAALRASVEENLASAKQRVRDAHGYAMEKATTAVRATDEYVHESPWTFIGVAAAVGLIIGLVIASDRR